MKKKIAQIIILSVTLISCFILFYRIKMNWQIFFIGYAVIGIISSYLFKNFLHNIIIIILIGLLFIIDSIFISFSTAIWLFPPITPDGHSVMPLTQLIISIPIAFFIATILCYFYFKKLRLMKHLEKYFFLILTLVFLIEFVIDYLN